MKRRLILALAMALTLTAGAEEANMRIEAGQNAVIDLNGDGAQETVAWREVAIDEGVEGVALTVKAADGATVEWRSDMLYGARVYANDLDGDGRTELFVTGDEMSDDYLTWCLRYENGALATIPFENGDRGELSGGDTPYGYGLLTAIDGNRVTLEGSQDVLGTYFCSRDYALKDGRFHFDDDGLWHMVYDLDDDWEWKVLTLKRPLTASILREDNAVQETLEAGTKLRLTSSDRVSIARFVTQDGREGILPIAEDAERGWGFVVEGIPEEELFELVPYSD